MQLKIGNIFVYDYYETQSYIGCLDRYRAKITITDTSRISGRLYYSYSKYIFHYSGNGTCAYNPFAFPFNLGTNNLIRVDSISGKVYYYNPGLGCSYSPDETMLDSLNAQLNDGVHINCLTGYPNNYAYTCIDTNNVKRFKDSPTYPTHDRTYTYGVGLTHSSYYSVSTNSTINEITMMGRVINGIAYGDTGIFVSVHAISNNVPTDFNLYQNYPNPFNPATKIKFDISKSSYSEIKIYDILGNEVADLVHEQLKPGSYEVEWDGSNFASGLYFYKLVVGDYVETKKMVLLK